MSDKTWNHEGLICQACSEQQIPVEQCKHVRGGKTRYEREHGILSNRFSNRSQREAWQKGGTGKGSTPFPRGSCNGKKNRFHV